MTYSTVENETTSPGCEPLDLRIIGFARKLCYLNKYYSYINNLEIGIGVPVQTVCEPAPCGLRWWGSSIDSELATSQALLEHSGQLHAGLLRACVSIESFPVN
jgi:hypothetical protein